MKYKTLPQHTIDFIADNWFKMSFNELSDTIGEPLWVVRNYINKIHIEGGHIPNSVAVGVNYPLPYAKKRVEDMLKRLEKLKSKDEKILDEISYMRQWLIRVNKVPERGLGGC